MYRQQRGIALITAIIVVSMVSIMLTTYVATVIMERKRVTHETATASAEYIARAGLEKAFIDLSSEHDRDQTWVEVDSSTGIYPNLNNRIDAIAAAVPDPTLTDTFNDGYEIRSDFQEFYPETNFDDGQAFGEGDYRVWVAFATNAASGGPTCPSGGCDFREGRIWVKSTGRIKDDNDNTVDEVTITQIAKVSAVALVEVDDTAPGRPLVEIEEEYGTIDYPTNSAEANPAARTSDHELRVSGASLDEDVDITMGAGETLMIRGGYGYDFSDGSRDTSLNNTTLLDASGAPTVVTISGGDSSSIVTMGGIRIE